MPTIPPIQAVNLPEEDNDWPEINVNVFEQKGDRTFAGTKSTTFRPVAPTPKEEE